MIFKMHILMAGVPHSFPPAVRTPWQPHYGCLAIGWLAASEGLSFFAVVCLDVVQGMFGSWYGGVGWGGANNVPWHLHLVLRSENMLLCLQMLLMYANISFMACYRRCCYAFRCLGCYTSIWYVLRSENMLLYFATLADGVEVREHKLHGML